MFEEVQQLGGESYATGELGGHARDWQFYPTSEELADRAWALFKNRRVERVLDACAGTGALADAYMRHQQRAYGRNYHSYHSGRSDTLVDVVEIDARHHPTLRDKGYNIVGLDFNSFDVAAGVGYSHLVANFPFKLGARFAIKAFEMLWDGEIVVILNAETVRNPCNSERRLLVQLIEQHGSVEFIRDAFIGPGVERETEVEVALVYLRKTGDCNTDHIAPLIERLSKDADGAECADVKLPYELALPANFVENQCRAFRMAVKAMREAVRAEAVANHFAARVGKTLAKMNDNEGVVKDERIDDDSIRSALRSRYMELKDRAWASILRSTETMDRLSQKVQKQAEAQFSQVKTLEFCEANVWGFLLGLVQSRPEMQAEMCEEVFDLITRYHSKNLIFYAAWRWRSNDKHRENGMRLRTTRFILPNNGSYSHCLNHEAEQRLGDIDKVFALMDGKQLPEYGLRDVFREHFSRLKAGERVSSDYFDVRFYPMSGTIHFFAKRKDLVDRLNKTVGKRRQWLPPRVDEEADKAFWKAYNAAEKLDEEVRTELAKLRRSQGSYSRFDDPIEAILYNRDNADRSNAELASVITSVLRTHNLLDALEHEESARTELVGSSSSPEAKQLLLT